MKPRPTCGPGDRGAVAIMVAVFVIVAMILLAFVIDRGRVYQQRNALQNAADAAALAGIQSSCGVSGDPVATARSYANQNGVATADTTVTFSGDVATGSTTTSYLNVVTRGSVSGIFGAFAGVGGSNVAAQATAARSCTIDYQFVADDTVTFSGNSADFTASAIYAGNCFVATGSSNKFGVIAVGTPGPGAAAICKNKDPIDIGTSGNTVQTSIYAPPVPMTVAKAAALKTVGSTGKTIDQVVTETKALPVTDCDNLADPGVGTNSNNYHCDKFTKFKPSFTGIIVSEGRIDLEAGKYLNPLIAALGDPIALNNSTEIGAGVILYAPDGGVVNSTGNAKVDLAAYIYSTSMKFSGSGVTSAAGAQGYGPGPFSLIK